MLKFCTCGNKAELQDWPLDRFFFEVLKDKKDRPGRTSGKIESKGRVQWTREGVSMRTNLYKNTVQHYDWSCLTRGSFKEGPPPKTQTQIALMPSFETVETSGRLHISWVAKVC